jgi:nucleoid-associated protein YgaU
VITQRSRYRRKDSYRTRDSARSAEPIEALSPHQPEGMEVRRQHVVQAGERLDQIATRYYGDPLKYWLICDANEAIFPEDLLVPGRILNIPRNRL